MKLFLLTPTQPYWDYDTYDAKLIRAESEQRAREIANESPGCCCEDIWLDPIKVPCEILTIEGKEEIIISSFMAG